MYSGIIGRLDYQVKIYIDGEFLMKTDCPESVIDLSLAHEFDIQDIDWSCLEIKKEVYIFTKG